MQGAALGRRPAPSLCAITDNPGQRAPQNCAMVAMMVQHDPLLAKTQSVGTPRAIALVDPDDRARRDLHLLLSGQRHRVRSYDCLAALTMDAKAVEAEWLVFALRSGGRDSAADLSALSQWRAQGWQGRLAVIADRAEFPDKGAGLIGGRDLLLTHPVAPHLWPICLADQVFHSN